MARAFATSTGRNAAVLEHAIKATFEPKWESMSVGPAKTSARKRGNGVRCKDGRIYLCVTLITEQQDAYCCFRKHASADQIRKAVDALCDKSKDGEWRPGGANRYYAIRDEILEQCLSDSDWDREEFGKALSAAESLGAPHVKAGAN
jgi:hypothetical protein